MYSILSESQYIGIRVNQQAFYNETGNPEYLIAYIVGFSNNSVPEFVIDHNGHRFYDVPLRFIDGEMYPSDVKGPCRWDPEPPKVVYLYDRGHKAVCHGSLTWSEANITLLVLTYDRRLFLWPPHKLNFSRNDAEKPDWLKARYPSVIQPYDTRVIDINLVSYPEIACKAIQYNEGWRSHGIGCLQKYVGDKRVHVWHRDSVKIGMLDGGIHNHRYDLTSIIIAGVLKQEEWKASPNPNGLWRAWTHDNTTKTPTPTDFFYDLEPYTCLVSAGKGYFFPHYAYHRTIPISEIVVTVVERSNIKGLSSALAYKDLTPVNGQTINLDTNFILGLARKHLGL